MRIAGRLPERIPDLMAAGAGPPLTINHGDYRLDNLFFAVDGSPCAVADWQVSTRARTGTFDRMYFLGASLDPVQRRRHGDVRGRLLVDRIVTSYFRLALDLDAGSVL